MPKYYLEHIDGSFVVDAINPRDACRKWLACCKLNIYKNPYIFINEHGFLPNQYTTEHAYDIRSLLKG